MSTLLNKRLARSLWRTKLRLFAVIFMVSVGVFAGITFGGYSHNLDGMYETMHADDEDGANLADLWIDNRSTMWSAEQVAEEELRQRKTPFFVAKEINKNHIDLWRIEDMEIEPV